MKLYNETTFTLDGERNGKGRHFTSRFLESGIASYKNEGGLVYLLKKETIDKFSNSFVGCPVIIKHADVTDDNVKDLSVGVISRVWFNSDDGWFYCEGVITDKQAEDLISQGWSVSCGYYVTDKDEGGGVWHDIAYDAEILNGNGEHLAIVPNPRYRDATILLNSSEESEMSLRKLFNAKKVRNSNKENEEMTIKNESSLKDEMLEKAEEIIEAVKALEGESDDELRNSYNAMLKSFSYEDKKENESEEDDEDDKKENESDEEESDQEEEKKENSKKLKNESSFETIEKLQNSVHKVAEPTGYEPESVRLARGANY